MVNNEKFDCDWLGGDHEKFDCDWLGGKKKITVTSKRQMISFSKVTLDRQRHNVFVCLCVFVCMCVLIFSKTIFFIMSFRLQRLVSI